MAGWNWAALATTWLIAADTTPTDARRAVACAPTNASCRELVSTLWLPPVRCRRPKSRKLRDGKLGRIQTSHSARCRTHAVLLGLRRHLLKFEDGLAVALVTLQADDSGIEPADVAEVLARAKAETVSRQRP